MYPTELSPTTVRLTGPAGAPVGPTLLLPTPKRIVAAVALTLALLVGVVGLDMLTAQPALAVEEVEEADNTCGNLPIISAACRELLDGAAWLESGVADVGETVVAGAFDYFARWVATGAIGAIELVWVGIDGTTTPSVDSGSTVFQTSIGAARALAFPLLVAAALYSLLKRDASIALKSAFLYLPGSVVGMIVAGYIINGLLLATDELSAAYLDDGQGGVAEWLNGVGGLIAAGVGIAAPILLVIFSFVVIGGAILVWLVMIVRSAAIVITYAFMPLAFAAIIFPATRSWIKRLIEIQLSFILAKPVIVAVLALGSQTLNDVDNALVAMMQAAALFYLAAFSPFALMKLLPFVGDEAVAAMEQPSGAPSRAVATAAGVIGGQKLAGFLAGSQQDGPGDVSPSTGGGTLGATGDIGGGSGPDDGGSSGGTPPLGGGGGPEGPSSTGPPTAAPERGPDTGGDLASGGSPPPTNGEGR